MKKYVISIITLVIGLISVRSQTISVSDVTFNAGETKAVSIYLENTQPNIVSFQMDLILPDGITLNKTGCKLSNRFTDEDQELVIGKQPDGSYRLTSTSLSLTPISGNIGEIVKLSLSASESAKGGTASIKNIRLATSDSEKLTPDNTTFLTDVSYTLTYKVDGNEYKTKNFVYGSAVIPEENPTREGYTFSGWSEIPETMPNHNVEVTGSFNINSYTLIYQVDDEEYKTLTLEYGSTITPEEAPTKEGYTFSGWSAMPTTMPAHDVIITGYFIVNNYALTYIVDGVVYKTQSIAYGATLIPESSPVKVGYTFSGWSEMPEMMPAHDLTVTGSFAINSYTLTYLLNGEVYKTESIVYGTPLVTEPSLEVEGYTFSGWSDIPETMPARDVTIRGSLTINSYTLTYQVDRNIYKTSSVVYGTAITPEEDPTKEGYTFSGWSDIPETMPARDVVITGSFTINSYTLTYKIDDDVYKTSSVVYGTAITPEEEPTREGYTFSGWSDIPKTMPAHDVDITGSFTINSYTLTYLLDDEKYITLTLEYGSTITPEEEPTKEGYTFSGWSEIPTTMPAHNVIITGYFMANSYTLTYMVDNEKYKTQTIAFGTVIIPEEFPIKEGYTFSGWRGLPETMPASDVTVTGSFRINKYTLSYILDGKVYKSYVLDYNSAITMESAPVKKGMTFSGWGDVPEAMPAYDLTLSGTYNWSEVIVDSVIYQVTDTLYNYASIVGTEAMSGDVAVLSDIEIGEYFYSVNDIAENALPKTLTISVPVGRLLLCLWNKGYKEIVETGSGRKLDAPQISLVSSTASSLSFSYKNEYQDLKEVLEVSGLPVSKENEEYKVSIKGLTPNTLYVDLASITLTIDDASYTRVFSFKTEPLSLITRQPKVVSIGNAVVTADSNLDDEETNIGFEWRRTDWTDEFTSNTGVAYLYEGTMEGYIRNLYTEKLWKVRPYYQDNSGIYYYGEWVGLDPTNTSYYEPTVHTYARIDQTENKVQISGYVQRGTDDVRKQGFKYWEQEDNARGAGISIPSDAKTIEAKGRVMEVDYNRGRDILWKATVIHNR